jgi:hypothetical protein
MESDPLSDVLRTVHLTSALFFLWNVSWPFATPVPDVRLIARFIEPRAQQFISYHIVTKGVCWGVLPGERPVPLEAGDILLIPRGDAYVISSSERLCTEAPIETANSLTFFRQIAGGEPPFVVNEGGGSEDSSHLVCGFLGCDMRPFNPVLAALPPLVRVRPPADPAEDRLQSLIEHARRSATAARWRPMRARALERTDVRRGRTPLSCRAFGNPRRLAGGPARSACRSGFGIATSPLGRRMDTRVARRGGWHLALAARRVI